MADPRTIIVPLTSPGQTATYRLAPGVTQYIQSVVATVNTAASGDVVPVLTISEQSGVVVGDKQQTNAIAGGGSGRATWALGLADETQVFRPVNEWAQYFERVTFSGNTHQMSWALDDGTDLFDLSNPGRPQPLRAGTYAFSFTLFCRTGQFPGDFARCEMDKNSGQVNPVQEFSLAGITTGVFHFNSGGTADMTVYLDTTDFVDAIGMHTHPTDLTFDFTVTVARLN